jgi:hypothetical protein
MPRRIRRTVGALTAMFFGAILAACSGSPGVPAPPAAASPERVARVYLHAAVTGNCELTAVLTLRTTWSWCSDPKLLNYRKVGRAYFVAASAAGRDQECVDFLMDTHGSSDGSMPVGWQPWGLCFVRTHSGWRMFDQGQG